MEDPGPASVLLNLIVLVILVLVNAFFAMSELAILQINQNKMKKLAAEGDKRAKRLLTITAEPSDFLATIQVGVTLSGFLASAVAADKFAGMLAEALMFLPIDTDVIQGVSLVVITLVLSYFTLVFGELVPKRLAMKFSDKLALSVSGVLTGLNKVLKPIIRLLAASTNGVSRLLGIKGDEEEQVTQEDILLMVEEGEEKGSIEEMERQMIQNIFKLEDKQISEVMTHRTDMAMVSADATIEELLQLARKNGYSRIPVFQGDVDDVIGIIHVKDLIGVPEKVFGQSVRAYLRKPIYVPEGKLCSKLLIEFQENKTHMAIVIDEYGGTAGLVTFEDLLEVIVGEIQDESDDESPDIEKIGEHTYLFEGDVLIEDVEETLKVAIDNKYDCDTIAGYIMAALGNVPKEPRHDPVSLGNGYTALVQELDDRRISRVKVYDSSEYSQGI